MLRPSPREKADMLSTLRDALRIVESLPIDTRCCACAAWRDGHCATWSTSVPEDAREAGCSSWTERPT